MDYKKFSLFDRIVVIVIILAAIVFFVLRTERANRTQNQSIAAIVNWINYNIQVGKLDIPPQFKPIAPQPTQPKEPKKK